MFKTCNACLPGRSRAAEQGCLTTFASFMAFIQMLTPFPNAYSFQKSTDGGSQDAQYLSSLQYAIVEL